jgi:hypothetical protein
MNASSPKKQESALKRQYSAVKKQILQIGFIMEGSLSKRYLTCGKPLCRCLSDPTHRHGPYYQLTWKRNGRTVAKFIPESLALQYEEWIRNRQSFSKILIKMHTISKKAIDCHFESLTEPSEKTVVSSVNKKLRKT